jgi:hypothetical protein
MRALLLFAALLAATPALASDRFGADNPWFEQFEATCRDGSAMNEECQAGVLSAYAEQAGTENVSCDFAVFWQTKDEQFASQTFGALPWQNGVEAIVAAPGVCEVN